MKAESDLLQIIKSVSHLKSAENPKSETSSQIQMADDVQDQEEVFKKINACLQLSKLKKVAIFHQFFSIFYIFVNILSRPLRFTLLYLKNIHTLAISLLFYGYNTIVQQVIIALINSSIMKIDYFIIIFTFKKGLICK
ncbi:hypothetical protein ABPG72_002285 [Tetrahymena utriculariae]